MANRFTDRLAYHRSQENIGGKGEDDYFLDILSSIEKYGLSITHVFSNEDDAFLDFSYSIGLYDTYGQPEIIVSGFPMDLAQFVINELGRRYEDGFIPQQNTRYQDFLGGGMDVVFRLMSPTFIERMMLSSMWFYDEEIAFPAYQCICPDLNNVFPWEDGFDESWRKRQALLFEGAPITAVEQEILDDFDRSRGVQ
ncbi:DUF4262 domain-containing protein [Terriglobus tenax]|uniref:DUF4262 domain-containing protein n=1 Tax=Terriglobus tenax TaxID=1111115 RepID=UPI0021E0A05E|nr:DUF4262 domain-containing protein [Terriglobus tenax]